MVPTVALAAWALQPHIAERATETGWFVSENPAASGNGAGPTSDD